MGIAIKRNDEEGHLRKLWVLLSKERVVDDGQVKPIVIYSTRLSYHYSTGL